MAPRLPKLQAPGVLDRRSKRIFAALMSLPGMRASQLLASRAKARGSRNRRSPNLLKMGLFLFLVWGKGYTQEGDGETRQRGGPTSEFHGCRACERSAFSETLVRTKRAKEVERSDAKRFGEGRMLVATRELRRPILPLRAPPKRLQAALRFLRVRLGRRLRWLWLLVFFPPGPLLRRLALLGCHCLGIA